MEKHATESDPLGRSDDFQKKFAIAAQKRRTGVKGKFIGRNFDTDVIDTSQDIRNQNKNKAKSKRYVKDWGEWLEHAKDDGRPAVDGDGEMPRVLYDDSSGESHADVYTLHSPENSMRPHSGSSINDQRLLAQAVERRARNVDMNESMSKKATRNSISALFPLSERLKEEKMSAQRRVRTSEQPSSTCRSPSQSSSDHNFFAAVPVRSHSAKTFSTTRPQFSTDSSDPELDEILNVKTVPLRERSASKEFSPKSSFQRHERVDFDSSIKITYLKEPDV